jgi:hypothetical protein
MYSFRHFYLLCWEQVDVFYFDDPKYSNFLVVKISGDCLGLTENSFELIICFITYNFYELLLLEYDFKKMVPNLPACISIRERTLVLKFKG